MSSYILLPSPEVKIDGSEHISNICYVHTYHLNLKCYIINIDRLSYTSSLSH